MSAICGIYGLDGQPMTTEHMTPMMNALASYGADGANLCCSESVALGHQMTHVTPESLREALPWQDSTTQLIITADVRLDNRDELFAAFAIPHPERHKMPDSELILLAYQKWGQACPSYLLGDFAFAIWDAAQQQLFCARDQLGIKPFYYFSNQHIFVFASDIRGLLACKEVSRQANYPFIAAYFKYFHFTHTEFTFYESILKLPPGNILTVTSQRIDKQRYWSPTEVPAIHLKSNQAYTEMLLDLLDKAIRSRLRSAYPVGAHVSGGFDSSSIAVLAARALREAGHSLHGFSWSPPPQAEAYPLQDERARVEAVCAQEKIICHYAPLSAKAIGEMLQRHIFFASYYHEVVVRQKARQAGVRVLLSGWGGDQFITDSGKNYFAPLFLSGRWVALWRQMQKRADLYHTPLRSLILRRILLPLLPDALYYRIQPEYERPDVSNLLNPDFAEQMKLVVPLPQRSIRERGWEGKNQSSWLANGVITNRIELWAPQGVRDQIEYRYPLLDRRLVEFSLGIPASSFFQHGWPRYRFRQAMSGILPERIQWTRRYNQPSLNAQHTTVVRQGWQLWTKLAQEDSTVPWKQYLDFSGIEHYLSQDMSPMDTNLLKLAITHAAQAAYVLMRNE